jgi:hypothetical protein
VVKESHRVRVSQIAGLLLWQKYVCGFLKQSKTGAIFMKNIRYLAILIGMGLIQNFAAAEVRAGLGTYEYSGTCFPGPPVTGFCSDFGLADGAAVSGAFTFDTSLVSDTAFTDFLPTDPSFDFSFKFGNYSFNKSNLDSLGTINVMFLDSTKTELVFQNSINACLGALVNCYLIQSGAVSLTIGSSYGNITHYIDGVESVQAGTHGAWISVTEPPVNLLFAGGLLTVMGMVRLKRDW